MDRLNRCEICADGQEIVVGNLGVIGVRHHRKQMRAVAADALCEGAHKFLVAPLTDPGLAVGGYIAGSDCPERRLDLAPPGHRRTSRLVVATAAVADDRQIMAALDLGEILAIFAVEGRAGCQQDGRRKSRRLTHPRSHASTSGPGFFTYCERIAAADQKASAPTVPAAS